MLHTNTRRKSNYIRLISKTFRLFSTWSIAQSATLGIEAFFLSLGFRCILWLSTPYVWQIDLILFRIRFTSLFCLGFVIDDSLQKLSVLEATREFTIITIDMSWNVTRNGCLSQKGIGNVGRIICLSICLSFSRCIDVYPRSCVCCTA